MEFLSPNSSEKMASESHHSFFSNVPLVPEPPVYAVMAAYRKDTNPLKLNLGIGVYRTEEGKPYVMNVVRRAEKILADDMSIVKEYLPITGTREFNESSANLILGIDSPAIKEKRVSTVQCVAGCGALRVGAEFLEKHYHQRTVYIPEPTYQNHPNFFSSVGLVVKTYRYYDPKTHTLDFQGLLEDLSSVESGAIVLLQACGHNPTGVDPTITQWDQIRELIRVKSLLPLFDSAYQGLVSGDLEEDAKSIRLFVADGNECLIAQSYSKNMGLYGDRVGALTIVCKNAEVAKKVESQIKLVIRPMYSNPPIHGASIVTAILNNQDMYGEWRRELRAMTHRLVTMRRKLFNALRDRGTPGDWSHIVEQVGMYSISGLNPHQVDFVTNEYHIYMSSDGRINMAGLGSETIPHLAEAIHAAVTIVV